MRNIEKAHIDLSRLLVEIWKLMTPLMRTQRDVRSMVGKKNIVLDDHHEQTFCRNMRISELVLLVRRVQMRMRNMLLKVGEKGILFI